MRHRSSVVLAVLLTVAAVVTSAQQPLPAKPPTQAAAPAWNYTGTPFTDRVKPTAPQQVPGVVCCAYYDRGGEGIAYHDSDAKNNGSGALNPADGTYNAACATDSSSA